MLVTELIQIIHDGWQWKQRWITADTTTHGQLIAKQLLCLMVNDNGCTAIEKCCYQRYTRKRSCCQCFSVIVADVVCLLNVGRKSHWALRNNVDNHPGADAVKAARRFGFRDWATIIWGSGWPGIDFHWFSIKFLWGADHFGALAGWVSIFIDFQLNSY